MANAMLDFTVGAPTFGATLPTDGTFDELAVYDHALSATRIVRHHDAGIGK
jgi:hypothetical protein